MRAGESSLLRRDGDILLVPYSAVNEQREEGRGHAAWRTPEGPLGAALKNRTLELVGNTIYQNRATTPCHNFTASCPLGTRSVLKEPRPLVAVPRTCSFVSETLSLVTKRC